jgi:hypothetical protein
MRIGWRPLAFCSASIAESRYSVRPLQPGCPHVQSMSGVFSIASHCVLQYFPEVTVQEQTGCAHFLPAVSAMLISFSSSRSDSRLYAAMSVGRDWVRIHT